MEKTIDIIVSGNLCLDLLPEMDKVPLNDLPSPGHLFDTGPMHISTGGAVSNTGLALHRLGIDVRLMSTVGDDAIGQMITDFLKQREPHLAQNLLVRQGIPSSYTVVLSPEKVDRIFLHWAGTNAAFSSSDLDYELVRQSKMLHLGYPPLLPRLVENGGEELELLYQRAKACDTVTSLDMTLPDPTSGREIDWHQVLERTLPYVDIFVPSIEEALFMLRRADYDRWHGSSYLERISLNYLQALANEILEMGTSSVVGFKLGELGMYLHTAPRERFLKMSSVSISAENWGDRRVWHPAFKVNVAGTTGAGDSAYAGLLSAILKGFDPESAVRWACAVGACNVEAADSTSGVQSWEATQRRIENGWETHARKLT